MTLTRTGRALATVALVAAFLALGVIFYRGGVDFGAWLATH